MQTKNNFYKMIKKLTCFSPAKINLFLYILKKREDGYHEILSDLARVSLYDKIEIESFAGKKSKLKITRNYITTDIDLIQKAILLLEKETRKFFCLDLKIKKTIPIGAGLGGGSSNVASVLNALNELFVLQLSLADLCKIGAKLGSDIPFFLHQKNLRVGGRGEKIIQPITIKNFYLLLLKPHFDCSTIDIYQNYKKTEQEKQIVFSPTYNFQQIKKISVWQNSLYKVVCQKHPLLKIYYQDLQSTSAIAIQMSGSGSCLFAIYKNEQHRMLAEEKLSKKKEQYTLYPINFI